MIIGYRNIIHRQEGSQWIQSLNLHIACFALPDNWQMVYGNAWRKIPIIAPTPLNSASATTSADIRNPKHSETKTKLKKEHPTIVGFEIIAPILKWGIDQYHDLQTPPRLRLLGKDQQCHAPYDKNGQADILYGKETLCTAQNGKDDLYRHSSGRNIAR